MHIAASSPKSLSEDDLDQTLIENEKSILKEQLKDSGKPDEIISKMIDGKIKKFFEENVLLNQKFVMDSSISINFDIDFCRDRRDEVLNYVYEKYGKDHVAQIITFGKLQARAVLRDIGRVLGVPYGQVDYLTKLIPFDPSRQLSLREYIDDEPKLTEEANKNPKIKKLLSIALKLEGLKRHASIHAAGVVISTLPGIGKSITSGSAFVSTIPITGIFKFFASATALCSSLVRNNKMDI